jgi:catechol 2,3-dioxygenase-like lactoylglutathione lyase family enzyme
MIDHTGIGVADVARSAAFYDAALGALGLRRVVEMASKEPGGGLDGVAYGTSTPCFWIDRFHPHGTRQHTAFAAGGRAEVDAFHAAALAAGGTDHGAPGLRDTADGYPPGYYAAFALDPDGNNIEAVCRETVG